MRRYPVYSIIALLVVSILTNGLSMSFRGEVFAHELDHIRYSFSADPTQHLEMHRNNASWDGIELDAATNLCLHSAGQFQPFFFYSFPQLPDIAVTKALIVFVSAIIPETIPDLPLRPPRSLA